LRGLVGVQDAAVVGHDDHADDDAIESAAERVEQVRLHLVIEGLCFAPDAIRLARDPVPRDRH
jgi:hypothetical protein